MDINQKFIEKAIELSTENVRIGGGPFGAIIVKDRKIIGKGVNTVTLNNDPTAHAEVNAIRDACKNTNTFNLKDCIIYSSCEPCPMCLSAIYWSNISKVYFSNKKEDAAKYGFKDDFIYQEFTKPYALRQIPFVNLDSPNALNAFTIWAEKIDKIEY